MGHWKIGVKILCSKSWEGQNSMKAKIWGSKFYFFLVEPLVKILCSLKRGVKILYFFPVPWKRGVKTAEPTNQLHWRGAPPGLDLSLDWAVLRLGVEPWDLVFPKVESHAMKTWWCRFWDMVGVTVPLWWFLQIWKSSEIQSFRYHKIAKLSSIWISKIILTIRCNYGATYLLIRIHIWTYD